MYNKAASLTDSKSPQTAKQDEIMCKKFTKYLSFQQATMWKLVVNFLYLEDMYMQIIR